MARLHILRVFVGENGTGGNLLGVFLDGAAVPESRRQSVAADLGFAETVFVEDIERGALRIFTPADELPFPAGRGVPDPRRAPRRRIGRDRRPHRARRGTRLRRRIAS